MQHTLYLKLADQHSLCTHGNAAFPRDTFPVQFIPQDALYAIHGLVNVFSTFDLWVYLRYNFRVSKNQQQTAIWAFWGFSIYLYFLFIIAIYLFIYFAQGSGGARMHFHSFCHLLLQKKDELFCLFFIFSFCVCRSTISEPMQSGP